MTFVVGVIGRQFGPGGSVPAAPTLAVADNADGTGGVATITLADAGAAITVYSQTVDGDLGTGTWVSRGTRVGNGTVNVAPGNGYYWWKAESEVGDGTITSNLVYQNLTDATTAVHYRCLTGVQSRIQGMTLAGVLNASVILTKLPTTRRIDFGAIAKPAVLIYPLTESIDPKAGLNSVDDVVYPVGVTIVAADDKEPTFVASLGGHLLWRQKLSRAFRNSALAGAAEVYQCDVKPSNILIKEAWTENLWASSFVLAFISREVRGL